MSLPLNLHTKLDLFLSRLFASNDADQIALSRNDLLLYRDIFPYLNEMFNKPGVTTYALFKYSMRRWSRIGCPRPEKCNGYVEENRFIRIDIVDGRPVPQYSRISIPLKLKERYSNRQAKKMKAAMQQARLEIKVIELNKKFSNARHFPAALRELIWARDNYSCTMCSRTLQEVVACGEKLEIHHLQAWGDGGRTVFENGESICSSCHNFLHRRRRS